MTKTIEVDIFGQRYTIKGDTDDAYVKRVAAYVDAQMQQLAGGMKTATPTKVAVLAAINIAHQLFQTEQRCEQGEADVERRALCLMESIDEHLQPARNR